MIKKVLTSVIFGIAAVVLGAVSVTAQETPATSEFFSNLSYRSEGGVGRLQGTFKSTEAFNRGVGSSNGTVILVVVGEGQNPADAAQGGQGEFLDILSVSSVAGDVSLDVEDPGGLVAARGFISLRYIGSDGVETFHTTPMDIRSIIGNNNPDDDGSGDPNGSGGLPLQVTVNWDENRTRISGADLEDPTPRPQHYIIFSDGFVTRTRPEDVFLQIQEVPNGPIQTLCRFEGGAGDFLLSYPACDTGSVLVPSPDHIFEPGKDYEVFFADSQGAVINSTEGDGRFRLPTYPELRLSPDLVEMRGEVKTHPSAPGAQYFQVRINITESVPGEELDFRLRSTSNAEFFEPRIGSLAVAEGTYILPEQIPANALPAGTYEAVALYQGQRLKVEEIGRIGGGDGNDDGEGVSAGTGLGGIFGNIQWPSLDGALVPDCGYDIRTLSNKDGTGRICGVNDLISIIQNIIEYLFVLILPIVAIILAYIGYLYITSGGSSDKRNKIKKIARSMIYGIILMMAAWLIVTTILSAIGVDPTISEQFIDITP